MNKKLKRKWIAALRGGTFTQIGGQMWHGKLLEEFAPNNHRCVLGVLSAISGQDSETITPYGLGLEREHVTKLIEKNDALRQPFPVMADWIEENL